MSPLTAIALSLLLTSQNVVTIAPAPATFNAATVDDALLDAAAYVDMAHVLELRQSKQL